MRNDPTNSDDMIDLRDVTERFEELESELDHARETYGDQWDADETVRRDLSREEYAAEMVCEHHGPEADEFKILGGLLDELKGYGGDHQWRGDWYPGSLIRDSYFADAMQELCEDIGDLPKGFPVYMVIDWEATARNLQVDYSSVEFDGVTYWYR